MGYLHIDNLYKNQDILLFKECYAMEKIHGTSAHLSWNKGKLGFFSGGSSYPTFLQLFDKEKLTDILLKENQEAKITIYGEAYAGKQQGMRATYGNEPKFIAFDVLIGDRCWLNVPIADEFCTNLGIDFVAYEKVSTDIQVLDAQRDLNSRQAVRNGILTPKPQEGIVMRPLIEMRKNNGARVIAKHKILRETLTPRKVQDPARLVVLTNAREIAEEWVTPERFKHVMDKIANPCIESISDIIQAMVEDVKREGEGEIVWSKEVTRAIGKKTVKLFFIQQKQA